MKKKIGIIGSNGFVGHHLIDEILIKHPEYEVVAFVYNPKRYKINFLNKVKDIRELDVLDIKSLQCGLFDIDILVYSVMGSSEAIIQGLENTLKIAERFKTKKIIYLSSIVVFSDNPKEGSNDDSSLLLKQDIEYNRAKVQAEFIVDCYRKRKTLNIITIRPGYIYGENGLGHTIYFLKRIKYDFGNFYLLNEGKGVFNGIYVKNLTHLIMLAIKSQVKNENFNAVDGYRLTWYDLFENYAKILNRDINSCVKYKSEDILVIKNNLISKVKNRILKKIFFPKKLMISGGEYDLYFCQHRYKMSKAKSLLNYNPLFSFQDAIKNIIDWIHKNPNF